uniref:Histidine rich calcium binding protein n=1 Tax=Mus musculus TaxID=10090 RepID=A0A1B0GQY1_MOUSE
MGFQGPWLHTCLLWATVAILLVPPVVTQELRGAGLGLGNWNNNAGIPGSSEDLSTEFGHHIHRGYQALSILLPLSAGV